MTVTKNQSDKQKAEKNNWGGARKECLVIKKHADKWCKDNGRDTSWYRETSNDNLNVENTERFIDGAQR